MMTDCDEFAVYEYSLDAWHFLHRDTATNNLLVYSIGHKAGQWWEECYYCLGLKCGHQGGSFAIMNKNIGDILPDIKRCNVLSEASITKLVRTMRSRNLFFTWWVEDILKQRGIKDSNEDSLGHHVDTRGRIHLKY